MKRALITGASAGIGHATALRLAGEGYDLVLMARRADRLEQIRTELERDFHVSVIPLVADIRDIEGLRSQLSAMKREISKVNVLVNNAGLAKGTEKFQDADLADWDVMLDTNVKGLLALTRLLLPTFLANKNGHIVNIGSVAGRWVYPGGAVYCATKFAVRAISEGLRMDLLGTPIRVTNIEPGMVESEFSMVRFNDEDKAKSVYAGMTPLSSDDIADCISWTLSRPAHVNIQELLIFPTDQGAISQVHRI